MRRYTLIALLIALSGCNPDVTGSSARNEESEPANRIAVDADADLMLSSDPRPGEAVQLDFPDMDERPVMQLQVVLDRLGFTPGVIDGKQGISTQNAISGFQEANDLDVTGEASAETRKLLAKWDNIPATRIVTIPADFANEQFHDIPDGPADQAKLKRLGYKSLDEKLAERFHTTVETLKMLNPGGRPAGMKGTNTSPAPGSAGSPSPTVTNTPRAASSALPTAAASTKGSASEASSSFFQAGQKIRVPNVGADRIVAGTVKDSAWLSTLRTLGVGSDRPTAARVVVSKSRGTLKVYSEEDQLVGMYTTTTGSKHDPLPLGTWKVLAVAHNPPFSYNPELFWDVPDSAAKQILPPGPNGPVGVVWIDLSKEHYGIHGTPDPETIGRAQSHGCVRLTNWDAARLAQMVSSSTTVVFEA